jgi:hypothetical protein
MGTVIYKAINKLSEHNDKLFVIFLFSVGLAAELQ